MTRTLKFLFIVLLLAIAASGGWFAARHGLPLTGTSSSAHGKKVLFYQSPMHPWIKSDKPGNCTICGMKLVPVFDGENAPDASSPGMTLSESSINVLHVETAPASRQPLRRAIRVAGIIDDDDSRHQRLSAYVDGRIDRLMVNYVGAEVTAGQPLAHLYSPELITARDEYLLLLQQPASPQRARLLEAARARLVRMGLTPDQLDQFGKQASPPNYVEILAPISGTVIERKVYEGQYVKAGDVFFEIADFDQMWFVFDVYERDLAWIKVGQEVEITTPAVPDKVFQAPIAFIDPNLVPETRSAKARVILDNPHIGDPAKHRHELLHKLYAEGVVHVETPPTLVVPRQAVISPGPAARVYVARGAGEFEARRVRMGRVADEFWEVLDGLSEGERVVTTGNLLIDAQTQLDQLLPVSAPARALTEAQRDSAKQFFDAIAAVSAALAADDLAAFNKTVESFTATIAPLHKAFGAEGEIVEIPSLQRAPDLHAARKMFYAATMPAADFAVSLRQRDPAFAAIKIFECPMAKDAVPSAAQEKGRWVQLSSPLRNPFFGEQMLECGAEVKQ